MKYIEYNKPFSVICKGDKATIYTGNMVKLDLLNQIQDGSINIVPFSQAKEKNYEYLGEDLPILSLKTENKIVVNKSDILEMDSLDIELEGDIEQELTDKEYADIVHRVIEDEIKNGEGPDFVISRKFYAKIKNFDIKKAFRLFQNLLLGEANSYMTFIFYDGERCFVGASPEQHLKVQDGIAYMSPISGSLPKNQLDKLDEFLVDKKERNELFQVVDEGLKMMSVICSSGGDVKGPYLKEMNSIIHSEYYLQGKCILDPIDALRSSFFLCTVTGAPVENAFRIIKKYETKSRRYYAGVIVEKEENLLDSAILIRTVEIDSEGNVTLQAGATIVEESDPMKEAIETNAKVLGMIKAIKGKIKKFEKKLPEISQERLEKRNMNLSGFLFSRQEKESIFSGIKAILLDNRDDFNFTLAHMLRNMGMTVNVVRSDKFEISDEDIVLIGPGPGNPNEMLELKQVTNSVLQSGKKIIGICLGHQMIAKSIGLDIVKKDKSTQGMMEQIEVFGKNYRFGVYNSFAALSKKIDGYSMSGRGKYVDVIKSENIYSMQFHPESVFSEYGYEFLRDVVSSLLSNKD